MKATIDEAIRRVNRQDAYVVATTVFFDEDPAVYEALAKVVASPGRRRPFHWADEGEEARGRMIECLISVGLCAFTFVHHPTARSGQERARAAALTRLVPLILREGADELIIERRTPRQDRLDQATILDVLAQHEGGDRLAYNWGTKADPRLWLPDGVCGAVGAYLDGSDPAWFHELFGAGVLTEPTYISGA